MKFIFTVICFFFLFALPSQATHLFGGEIQASKISGQNYKVSVKLYYDHIVGKGATSAQNSVKVCFGDGNYTIFESNSEIRKIEGTDILVRTYEGFHTYSSPGTFQISVSEDNRSTDILNIQNSVLSSQFIWTVIDTKLDNTTPVFKDFGAKTGVRQIFKMDLNPLVTEKDSMSYKIARLSRASPGTCGVRMSFNETLYPNDVSQSGKFYIDNNNQLTWIAPELKGKYIYAIIAYEWRDGIKISETYREGIILVEDLPGEYVTIPEYLNAENLSEEFVTGNPNSASEINLSISAYPIPTVDKLNINVTTGIKQAITLQLLNLKGQILNEYYAEPSFMFEKVIETNHLMPGLYILRANTVNGSAYKKIIKK